MCPSYMATSDEQYSTRGRARLLFEMTKGEVIRDGWRSQEVRDALDLCLACKACRSECPVRVDMAAYKAEFMHHHYRGRVRPREAYSMGLIWWWARAASHMPGFANMLMRSPLGALGKAIGGFAKEADPPRFATPSFHAWFAGHKPAGDGRRGRVLLWPDTFNAYFTPAPLQATVTLLEREGWQVEIPKARLCCGRPLYSFGFLDLADRLWRDTLAALRPYIREDIAIIGLEPTCVAAFRDELMQMRAHDRDAQRLSGQVVHLSEFLKANGVSAQRDGVALVHPHCHHRAIIKPDAEVDVLRNAGLDVELLDVGCCGMAGDFGFRAKTYPVARRLGERAFLPRVRDAGEALFVADGFSCREQARQGAGARLLTLPEVLCRSAKP
jgi:Fe-S oxidoreductase